MFAFLPGNNTDLSLLELSRVFGDNPTQVGKFIFLENYYPKELGAVSKVYELSEITDFKTQLEELLVSFDDKEVYVVSNTQEVIDLFEMNIKELTSKILPKSKISFVSASRKYLANEVIIAEIDYVYYIGKTIKSFDSREFKILDEYRLKRKFTHGTSPRLARVMINLLALEKGKTILDPFCGTATLLLEALRQGYNVVGLDTDEGLIADARENIIDLIEREEIKNNYKLKNSDAQSTKFSADAVVFEPYMGPFLSELPSKKAAQMIIEELQELYFLTFKNLYKNLKEGSIVVCVLPSIPYKGGTLELNLYDIFQENFVMQADAVEYEAASGSTLKRKIYILERQG